MATTVSLKESARNVVRTCARVQPGERVCVAADRGTMRIALSNWHQRPRPADRRDDGGQEIPGSVHIAIGDNHVIGGTVVGELHLEGLLLRPTVEPDGRVVVADGRLLAEALGEDACG